MASYQARKQSGEMVLASASSSTPRRGGLLATLFGGGGADEEEDTGESAVAAAAPKARAPTQTVAALPTAKPLPGIQIVAPENAQRAELPQGADQAPRGRRHARDNSRRPSGSQRAAARRRTPAAGRGRRGDG